MNATRPSPHFLVSHPAHFVALGFGSGLAPAAPGTFGTLVAIPIAALLRAYAGDAGFVVAILLLLIVGAWSAHVTARHLGTSDHGSIVIDEIAAFLLVLYLVGSDPLHVILAFVLFRIFDIAKPPPIKWMDEVWTNGAGVMADDLVAAVYTLLVFALVRQMLS